MNKQEYIDRLIEAQDTYEHPTLKPHTQFTISQMDVALLITAGLNNKAISNRLNCKIRTVERHIGEILFKLLPDDSLQVRVSIVLYTLGLIAHEESKRHAKTPFPIQTTETKPSKILYFR